MKELGGKFEKAENFKPFVVTDGKLITGQNPASKSNRNIRKKLR